MKKFDPFGRGKKGDAILQQAKDIGASILDPNQDFQQSIASLRADDRNLDMMMKTMKTVDFEKLLVLNRREESKKRIEVTAGKAEIEGQMEPLHACKLFLCSCRSLDIMPVFSPFCHPFHFTN